MRTATVNLSDEIKLAIDTAVGEVDMARWLLEDAHKKITEAAMLLDRNGITGTITITIEIGVAEV